MYQHSISAPEITKINPLQPRLPRLRLVVTHADPLTLQNIADLLVPNVYKSSKLAATKEDAIKESPFQTFIRVRNRPTWAVNLKKPLVPNVYKSSKPWLYHRP